MAPRRWPAAGFFLPLAAASLAASLLPRHLQLALVFDRAAIAAGEVWRLLTSPFVHLGWSHLALDLAALVLVAVAVGPRLSVPAWYGVALATAVGGSLGVLALSPRTPAMAGLSGLGHGLFVAGAVVELRRGSRWAGLLLLALVAAKLAWEQLQGAVPGAGGALGAPVALDAHLYSSLAGLLAGLAAAWWSTGEPGREALGVVDGLMDERSQGDRR